MAIRFFHHQRRPRVAFVLGGGGNLGSIQVGQLKALIERGIRPDVVIGCSVGALNGAAVAGNPTFEEVGRLEALWAGLQRKNIFPSSRFSVGPWLFMRNGLSAFGNHGLQNVIERWLPYRCFEEAAVPLWIVATSVRTGLEEWFGSGDIMQPLLASTALPGVFPPVQIGDDSYVDGGVVNNVPVSKAISLGAKQIYVLDVGNVEHERRAPKRPYQMLLQAVGIAHSHRFRVDLGGAPEDVEVIRLPGVDAGNIRYDDFSQSASLIHRAYRAAGAYLDHPAQSTHHEPRRLRRHSA